ncbi:MAG: hypothetical protein K2O78_00145 [Muribaculaceae bacterium]|nr:hypothetical protein [Muribaculaceae bacterium]
MRSTAPLPEALAADIPPPGVTDFAALASLVPAPDSAPPGAGIPHPDAAPSADPDPFAATARRKWNADGIEPRCDFSPGRSHMVARSPMFMTFCVWRRSVFGPTLKEIKEDRSNIHRFAAAVAEYIRKVLPGDLRAAGWALTVPPARRHRDWNFAIEAGRLLAETLEIPFYPVVAAARSRERVGAVYDLVTAPQERNLLVFDDIITTGSTFTSMFRLLQPMGYNMVFAVGIDNKA